MDNELTAVTEILRLFNIESFVFVDLFRLSQNEEMEMMKQAMKSIDECDLLIAETSDKAIGIGVEVGYAKAKNKPVIYLRNKTAEHSTTVSCISDFKVIYADVMDLKESLIGIIQEIVAYRNKT